MDRSREDDTAQRREAKLAQALRANLRRRKSAKAGETSAAKSSQGDKRP